MIAGERSDVLVQARECPGNCPSDNIINPGFVENGVINSGVDSIRRWEMEFWHIVILLQSTHDGILIVDFDYSMASFTNWYLHVPP